MVITVKVSGDGLEEKLDALQNLLPPALLKTVKHSIKDYYAKGGTGHFSAVAGSAGYVISIGKNKYMGSLKGGIVPTASSMCMALGIPLVLVPAHEWDAEVHPEADVGYDEDSEHHAVLSTGHKVAKKALADGHALHLNVDVSSVEQSAMAALAVKDGLTFGVLMVEPEDGTKPVALSNASLLNQKVKATSSSSVYRVFMLGKGIKAAARHQGTTLSLRLEGTKLNNVSTQLNNYGFSLGDGYMSTHIQGVNSKQEMAAILGWAVYLIQSMGIQIEEALAGVGLGAGK